MTVLSNTITVPALRLNALHRALEEVAAEAQAPYYPYEETNDLLDHLRLVWEWTAQIEAGKLCCLLPDRDYVDIQAMERMFRIFAPRVEVRPGVPCHFAYRDDHTGEAFRYLLIAGEAGHPESPRVLVQRGELHWSTPGAFAPRREQVRVLADLLAEIGPTAHPLASEAGKLLALCLEQARPGTARFRTRRGLPTGIPPRWAPRPRLVRANPGRSAWEKDMNTERRLHMSQQLTSTTEKELGTFLFQKAHVQFRVGEQILTMRDCTIERGLKRRIPTRLWPITVFAVDEAKQVLDGRSVDLFVYADSMPGVSDMLEVFLTYPEAIREVWDARHARCYGFTTWDKQYGSDYEYVEQAQAQYEEYKAIAQKMRLLLGSRLFSVFRAMDL